MRSRDSLEGTKSCICKYPVAKKRDVTSIHLWWRIMLRRGWRGSWGCDRAGGLLIWRLVRFTGISHDAIAQESKRYWQNLEASVPGAQVCSLIDLLRFVSFLERPNGGHLADVVSTCSQLPSLLFSDLSYCLMWKRIPNFRWSSLKKKKNQPAHDTCQDCRIQFSYSV